MSPTDQYIARQARRMFGRHGGRALKIAREMVLQLQGIGDVARADDWLRIIVAIEELRRPPERAPS